DGIGTRSRGVPGCSMWTGLTTAPVPYDGSKSLRVFAPVCVTARIIMPTSRVHQFCILFGLSALLIGEALASTPVTPNLLVNGDAEAQRCTVDWTAQTSVPGWRVTRG